MSAKPTHERRRTAALVCVKPQPTCRFFEKTDLRLFNAEDPLTGKPLLKLEGPAVAATITLWNKGDLEVIRVELSEPARSNRQADCSILAA
jgi:hypothetical protein